MRKRNTTQNRVWVTIWNIIKDILGIASLVISAIVAFLSYQTLQEMQIERINTYMPDIIFGDSTFLIQTGKLNKHMHGKELEVFNNMDAIFNNKMEFGGGNPSPSIKLSMTNIGVGMAKNIKISVTRESAIKAINKFNKHSKWCKISISEKNDTGNFGVNLCYPNDDWVWFVRFDDTFEIPYMQANGNGEFYYPLSDLYYSLIYAMVLEYKHVSFDYYNHDNIQIPDIKIQIEYSDVQGIQYSNILYIHTAFNWVMQGAFGLKVSIIDN